MVEWSLVTAGQIQAIRHVSDSEDPDFVAISQDLRRALATELSGPTPGQLVLWDSTGSAHDAIETLTDQLGLPVSMAHVSTIADVDPAAEDMAQLQPAVALAHACMDDRAPGIDFLHGRLTRPKATWFNRRWRAAAAFLVLLAILLAFLILQHRRQIESVSTLSGQLEQLEPDIAAARQIIDMVRYGEGWYEDRPSCLECLRQLTLGFPDDNNIWATGLTLADDLRGLLTGRAVNHQSILDLMDELTRSERFSQVQVKYMQEAGRDQRHVSFAIAFAFSP